jgi:hypothetical protein
MDTYLFFVHTCGEYKRPGHIRKVYQSLQYEEPFATHSIVDESELRASPAITPERHMVDIYRCLGIHAPPRSQAL